MFCQKLRGFRFEDAIVGFGGQPTLWWMCFLKKGFYHCLVALQCNDQYLLVDPLIHCTDIVWISHGDMHLYLHKHGYRTLDVKIKEPKNKCLRISPFTCVETVKRILGIQKRSVFTPFKLFCYLNKKNKSFRLI